MAKSWYLSLDGRQLGPLPSDQVQRMAARGQIKPDTLIRPETQEQWLPAETWPQLFAGDKAAPGAPEKKVSSKRPSDTVPRAKAISSAPQPAPATPIGTIPRGIPAGVAVVAPVAAATGALPKIPVGAAIPSAASPTASGIPPVIVTDPTTARSKTGATKANDDGSLATTKKNRTPVFILGGAVVVLLVIGVVVVVANPFGGDGAKKPAATAANSLAAATTGPEADPNAAEGEGSVASRNAKVSAAAPAHKSAENGSAPSSGSKPAANKEIEELRKKVKGWKSASAGYKVGTLQYQVANVWLADERVDASADNPETTRPTESGEQDGKAKYLFVQVQVKNVGTAPLTYRGWNGLSAKDTAAVVLENENEPLTLAPATVAASERLKSVSIAPRSSVTDTLVFFAPNNGIETLHLMLPKVAVSGIGSGVFALEIPSAMISQERPAENILAGASNALTGKPPAKESELERERRLLAESLGGEPENKPNEPKPNEPKPKEPTTSKEAPEPDMPADAKPGSDSKEAKPAEPNLKSLLNTIEKSGAGNGKPENPKPPE